MSEITLSAAWGWLLAACAALVALARAWDIVRHWGKADIKSEIRQIDAKLEEDDTRIRNLEDSNAVTMRTLLALTRHSIDGNNVEGLKAAQREIQEYLIRR